MRLKANIVFLRFGQLYIIIFWDQAIRRKGGVCPSIPVLKNPSIKNLPVSRSVSSASYAIIQTQNLIMAMVGEDLQHAPPDFGSVFPM